MKVHFSSLPTFACFLFLLGSGEFGHGAEVGLSFTGQISFIVPPGSTGQGGMTYGIRLPDFSAVSGHVVYESNSSSSLIEGCTDCKGYIHKQINGLHVEFEGLTVQADEYIVQVRNDTNYAPLGTVDILSVLYPDPNGDILPKVAAPMLVNGDPVTTGAIRVDFVAPPTVFPDSNLPASLNPADFTYTFLNGGTSNFGDGVPPGLDLLFKLQSLTSLAHVTSDHDLDGDVDGRDFLIWERNVGLSTGDGDANSDLLVDGQDLTLWQNEYGSQNGALLAITVPEPTALALLFAGSLLWNACR